MRKFDRLTEINLLFKRYKGNQENTMVETSLKFEDGLCEIVGEVRNGVVQEEVAKSVNYTDDMMNQREKETS